MPAKKASKTDTKKRLVLLDAHAIIHRAYHALPDFAASTGEPTGALYGLSTMLMRIIADFKPDYIAACYDLAGKTFRHETYEAYKAGRKKADDALVAQLSTSREVFEAFNIPIYDAAGFEADDILGTIVEQYKKEKNLEIIIASGDMDTMQLIDGTRVKVFTLKKGLNDTVLYDEAAIVARYGFGPTQIPDFKGLKGDPSDNIVGVPGIGDKTATTLITSFGTIEGIYKALKKDRGPLKNAGMTDRIIGLLENHEDEALFSKTLATIRRDAPISFSLPESGWKEGVDTERIHALFKRLEFRSIGNRIDALFGETKTVPAMAEKEAPEANDPEDVRKIAVALWLIDSDKTTPTIDDILEYAGTRSFTEAKTKILADLKAAHLERVYEEIELPLIPIIDAAQSRGILIDVTHFKKLGNTYHAQLLKIEQTIYKHAGKEFNINSPKQLGDILFDEMQLSVKGLKKTAGGARSTRESELEKLKDAHPIIESILEYRELQKLLSTYIDVIPTLADSNGRLHTTFNQAGTTTGRMSSSSPNLQNIPVRGDSGKEIRRGFVAAPGHMLVGCDYSQIEMRVLALLSKDQQLIDIFKSGKDVHASVASLVFKVPEADVTADMRRKAKVINFGIIYGMGVNALKANLGGTREEAERFYDDYFKALPTIEAYFENVKSEAKKKGYTKTLFGRRRYFPGFKSAMPFVRAMAERMAMNAPLQGTAADIVKIAMQRIHERLQTEGLAEKAHLLLQVHDELIYEVETPVLEAVQTIIKNAMENVVDADIPLLANASVGPDWGALK